MTATPRLTLPFIVPGQAQKELFHNEALQRLDMLVQPVVEGAASNTPPVSPDLGDAFLVGTAPLDAWTDQAQALAGWTEGGWRFVAAFEGLRVLERSSGQFATFRSGSWVTGVLDATSVRVAGKVVLGPQQPAIASTAGGTVQDLEARAALSAILDTMRSHGLIAV